MADYAKTTWANGTTPSINGTNLNKIESGIQDAAQHHGMGLAADRPAANAASKNWIYFSTDSGVIEQVREDPTSTYAWVKIGGVGEPWQALTLLNSWATSGGKPTCAVRLDAFGFVELKGYLDSGFAGNIANLAAKYRPAYQMNIFCHTGGGRFDAGVVVATNGDLGWNGLGSTFIALNGVRYWPGT